MPVVAGEVLVVVVSVGLVLKLNVVIIQKDVDFFMTYPS